MPVQRSISGQQVPDSTSLEETKTTKDTQSSNEFLGKSYESVIEFSDEDVDELILGSESNRSDKDTAEITAGYELRKREIHQLRIDADDSKFIEVYAKRLKMSEEDRIEETSNTALETEYIARLEEAEGNRLENDCSHMIEIYRERMKQANEQIMNNSSTHAINEYIFRFKEAEEWLNPSNFEHTLLDVYNNRFRLANDDLARTQSSEAVKYYDLRLQEAKELLQRRKESEVEYEDGYNHRMNMEDGGLRKYQYTVAQVIHQYWRRFEEEGLKYVPSKTEEELIQRRNETEQLLYNGMSVEDKISDYYRRRETTEFYQSDEALEVLLNGYQERELNSEMQCPGPAVEDVVKAYHERVLTAGIVTADIMIEGYYQRLIAALKVRPNKTADQVTDEYNGRQLHPDEHIPKKSPEQLTAEYEDRLRYPDKHQILLYLHQQINDYNKRCRSVVPYRSNDDYEPNYYKRKAQVDCRQPPDASEQLIHNYMERIKLREHYLCNIYETSNPLVGKYNERFQNTLHHNSLTQEWLRDYNQRMVHSELQRIEDEKQRQVWAACFLYNAENEN